MVGNTSKDYTDAVNQEKIDYLINHPEVFFVETHPTPDSDGLKKELKKVLNKLEAIDVHGGLK